MTLNDGSSNQRGDRRMGEEGVSGEGKGNTVKVEREKNVEKEEQNKKINKWEE